MLEYKIYTPFRKVGIATKVANWKNPRSCNSVGEKAGHTDLKQSVGRKLGIA